MREVVNLDLIYDTFYQKIPGLCKSVLQGFSKFVCTNGATEKSFMCVCAPGFFLSACCFIPFHLCLVHVNYFKALVATEDYNRVIATRIHVNGIARM